MSPLGNPPAASVHPILESHSAPEEHDQPTRSNPKRRRCKNCDRGFMAIRHDHWFCRSRCRIQFHKNGNAFGKLKQTMQSIIRKELNRILSSEGIAAVQAAGGRRRDRLAAAELERAAKALEGLTASITVGHRSAKLKGK